MRTHRRRARLCLAATVGVSTCMMGHQLAFAQQNPADPTVLLNTSDASGNSSFAGGPVYNWSASSDSALSAGNAPAAGYAYVVTGSAAGSGKLLTPSGGSASFGGDSLTIVPYNGQANLYTAYNSSAPTNAVDQSAALIIAGNASGQVVTVNNLVLANGGAVINAGPSFFNNSNLVTSSLSGNIYLVPASGSLDGVPLTVSGGILDATIANVNSQTNLLVVNSTISGAGALHIVATPGSSAFSAVALNASNPSFSGGVNLDNTAGGGSGQTPTLLINNPNALGTGTFTITSAAGSTVGPSIDNATGAPLALATNNPMVWNGSFSYDKVGYLAVWNNSLNLGGGGVTLGNSLTLTLYGTGVLSETGTISGASDVLTVYNNGFFEVPSPASFQNKAVNVSSGAALAFSAMGTSAAQFASFPGSNTASGTSTLFNFSSGTSIGIDTTGVSGPFNQNVALTSPLGLAKLGGGTLLLSTANSYTGPTNVSSGTLQLGNASAISGTSGVQILPGATLDLNGYSISIPLINGTGNVVNNGSAGSVLTINTGSSSPSSTSAAIFGGNLSNGTSALGLTVNLTTATYNFNASGAIGTYTGATVLQKGTYIVGANTIPAGGTVAFNGGNLAFAAQPAGGFNLSVGVGSNYNFNAPAGVTVFLSGGLTNPITGTAAVNMSGGGAVIFSGTNSYTGSTNIGSGTFGFASPASFPAQINTSGIALTSASGSFGFGNSVPANFNLSIPISGAGGINKVGTDTVTLTGTNKTYTGTTNISGGTLLLGGSTALPSASNVSIGAVGALDMGGYNISTPVLIGSGLITNSTNTNTTVTVTTGTSGVGAGWSGNISNGSATTSLLVNLSSSGNSFNMSGSTNSYTGGTTLQSGTLVVGAASLPANGAVYFNGGSLDFTAPLTVDPSSNFQAVNGYGLSFNNSIGNTVTLSGSLISTAGVTMSGIGIVALAGTNNNFSNTITVNGTSTLGFASPATFTPSMNTSGVVVNGTGYFGIGNSNGNNFVLAIPISGTGGLNKIGANTVTITGNNTYTGYTNISSGTLVLGSATALGNNSAGLTTILGPTGSGPNGTLDLNGYSTTLYAPTGGGSGGVITNSNSKAATLTLQNSSSGTLYYYGSITGNLAVVVNYPGPPTSNSWPVEEYASGTAQVFSYTGGTTLASGLFEISYTNHMPAIANSITFAGGYMELAPSGTNVFDYSSDFSQAPNQQYNFIVTGSTNTTTTLASPLNSPGGTLTLGTTYLSGGVISAYGGTGTLILSGANKFTGATTVNAGTLQLANPLAIADTSSVTLNSTYVNVLQSSPVSLFPTLQINDSSGMLGLANGSGPAITVNLTGLGANPTAWTYKTGITSHTAGYAFWGAMQGTAGQFDVFAGNINLAAGGNPVGVSGGYQNQGGGSLALTGVISGTGPLVVGLNPNSTTILADANTYSGETQVTNAVGLAATVQLGANNAIPADSGLDFANVNLLLVQNSANTYGTMTLDLHGYSTSTAYVTSSTSTITQNGSTSNTGYNATKANSVITNLLSGSTSTLTILGNPTSGPFLGTYQDGTGKLALDYNGSGQVFSTSGTNNYSGGTTVDGGTLLVTSLASIGTTSTGGGNITVNANAILQGTSSSAMFAKLQTGYAGGNWNGSGINSTLAAGDSSHLTAVGMITASSSGNWENASYNAGDVLLKLTYYGDATLDGQVNSTDYTLIDGAYLNNQNASGPQLTGWQNGDFNYDGVINGSDYTLIDNAFNTQGVQIQTEIASPTAQISGVGTAAVPEPTSLAMIGLGVAGLLGRRRKH